MLAINLPGQLEVPLIVDHTKPRLGSFHLGAIMSNSEVNGIRLAKLLRSYDESPTSQKWIDIQQLAREILK